MHLQDPHIYTMILFIISHYKIHPHPVHSAAAHPPHSTMHNTWEREWKENGIPCGYGGRATG